MIIEYILLGIILLQCILHRAERKDLYTRLMCRDVQDYNSVNNKNPKTHINRHKEVLNKWRGKGGGKE